MQLLYDEAVIDKRKKMRTVLAIPTYNACGKIWTEVLEAIANQSLKCDTKFVIDSSSSDETVQVAEKYGFVSLVIDRKEFNHGLTRQLAADRFNDIDFIIFMTQDCILKDKNSFKNLLAPFEDPLVSVSYGRQLAGKGSSLAERYGRSFNYSAVSRVKTMADVPELGLHAAFCSDSFSAYRLKDLFAVGGFPKTGFGEDMLVAACLLMSGKRVAYCADAQCYHTHSYSVVEEFKRGLAIGKMHKENSWLLETFGKAESRGLKLAASAPIYLRPLLILENLPKYAGYILSKFF